MGRQRIALVIVGLGAWLWLRDGTHPTRALSPPTQATVLADGFAALHPDPTVVVQIDRDGRERRRTKLPVQGDVRVVGSRSGPLLAYVKQTKIELAVIDKNGVVKPTQHFGKNVQRLCDGTASNDDRFAVAWQEADGAVWFLRGPVSKPNALPIGTMTASAPWCAVRSAGSYLAVMWLDGVTVRALFCSDRECSGFITPMKIERGAKLLDVACQEGGCVVATQTAKASLDITSYDLRGKKGWSRSWDHIEALAGVHLASAGKQAYALSATTRDAAFVDRVLTKTGTSQREWMQRETTVPAMAWSQGQLLLAYRDHGSDVPQHRLLAFPP